MLIKSLQSGIQKTLGRWYSNIAVNPLSVFDKLQVEALNEKCYLVDENDKIIGNASKKDCHIVQKNGTIPLHRAFSVFLFNTNHELLLQKRSTFKITYPGCYTNACCSHPLVDFTGEDDENSAIGIKRAAQRRLNYELGIPKEQMPLDKFQYITRIHYYDSGDGKFGEHEIDYILFLIADVDLKPNSNEVSEVCLIPRKHMNTFHLELNDPLTPWFHLILKHHLQLWWSQLDNINKFVDHKTIYKL